MRLKIRGGDVPDFSVARHLKKLPVPYQTDGCASARTAPDSQTETGERNVNETIETMLKRRSVRAYQPEQIRDEDLEVILRCALYAPTGGNLQNSRFLVIQNPEWMEELNTAIRDELRSRPIVEGEMMAKGIRRAMQEDYHFIFHAPTLITAVAPRDHSNSMANCCTGLENMQIAATALGLGACWSNQPHWLTDVPKIREIFERLGLRADEDIFGSISVGYPKVVAKTAAARKEGRIVRDCECI